MQQFRQANLPVNPMATGSTCNLQDTSASFQYLSESRYLKPIKNPRYHPVPLGLRRSVSLEEASTDNNPNFLQKPKIQNASNQSLANSSLSSSLNCLCVRLRPHQLLPEYDQGIAQSANEHEFDWWESASHIRPLLENIILSQNFRNEFKDDKEEDDKIFVKFSQSKRHKRRDAICCTVDRLCYNEQTIYFLPLRLICKLNTI